MSTDFLKLTKNQSIQTLALMALLALLIVAGCISTEKSVKKVSRTEESQTVPVQSITPPKKPVQPSRPIAVAKPPSALGLDPDQLQIIGQKIFQNETGGKVKNLIFWSNNEAFPSLGVGHFIWFPVGRSLGFTESFPEIIRYLQANGAAVPSWLSRQISIGALWNSREQLEQERDSEKFQALQQLLIDTTGLQAAFLFKRLDEALPKMLIGLDPDKRERIVDRFYTVRASPGGLYPLVDYVNFKGEGTVTSEKHNRVGWGLLQVLELMESTPVGAKALKEFATAADLVLTRRVANAPIERNEQRWLPGWRVRLRTYYQ